MTHEQHAAAGRHTRAARSTHNRAAWAQECGRRERTRIQAKLVEFESEIVPAQVQAPKRTRTRKLAEAVSNMCTCSCGHTHADMTA